MDDIKTKVANLRTSNVYINLTNYYSKKSLFSIIGDDRNEKVHSNFIQGHPVFPARQRSAVLYRTQSSDSRTYREDLVPHPADSA